MQFNKGNMDQNTIQIIHISITVITTLSTVILGWISFHKESDKEDKACEIERNDLKMKVFILEERINNQIDILDKLDSKIDEVLRSI